MTGKECLFGETANKDDSIDFRFLNSNVFTGKFPSISSSFFLNGMAMIAVL